MMVKISSTEEINELGRTMWCKSTHDKKKRTNCWHIQNNFKTNMTEKEVRHRWICPLWFYLYETLRNVN